MGREPEKDTREERARVELQARFDTLASSSTQGIIVHQAFRPLFANQALATMFGYPDPDAILSLPDLRALFSDQVSDWLVDLGEARLRGETVPDLYEIEAWRRDGTVMTLQTVATAVSWDGEPAIMAHVIDVTDRKLADRAARRNEQLLRTVVANSPVILWSIDRDGILNITEGRGLRAQGLRHTEILGRSIFEIYADNPDFLANVRRALAGESFFAVNETRGAVYERFFQPIFSGSGEVEGVTGVSVDITHSARAEQEARESQRLLRSVIDALPHFVFLKDRDLRYRLVNESFARFHDLSVADMTGLSGEGLPRRTEAMRTLFADDDRRVLESGETIQRSGYEIELPEGGHADFDAIKLPLRNEEGEVTGIVGVVDNVTVTRRAQRELERYREHLEELVEARTAELVAAQDGLMRSERLAAIGQLTATVSHELRNPLGTIRTSFESLRPRIETLGDDRAHRALERIERSIDRCVKIIEELLGYTRSRALDVERADLDQWLTESVADAEAPRNMTLETRSDSGATVLIDRERARQALINLVQNAFQSIAESGENGRVEITATITPEMAEVHVHDSGPGVPEAVLARIFEPLYSTRPFGVGLGLPLVRSIAEQHGGDVEYGAPGAPPGSTFTLRLPLAGATGA